MTERAFISVRSGPALFCATSSAIDINAAAVTRHNDRMAGRKVQQDNHADQCCEITPDRREPKRVKDISGDHRRDDHRAEEPDTFVARQQRCEASCGCVKRKHDFFIIVRQTIADVRSNDVGANWVCRNCMCEKDRSYDPGDKRKQ